MFLLRIPVLLLLPPLEPQINEKITDGDHRSIKQAGKQLCENTKALPYGKRKKLSFSPFQAYIMPWLHRRFPDRKISGVHNGEIYCKMFYYCSQDTHYRQQLYSWRCMINSPNKSYCKLSHWQLHHSGGWGASGWCRAQQRLLLPNTKPFTRN